MAVLAPRKRDVVTFIKKDLLSGCRPLIIDSEILRALQGEKFPRVEEPDDPELDALYKKYLELLD